MITNLYEILGISNNATQTEIKTAYRQLANKYHPDRNPGKEGECAKIFATINKAYKVLSDFNSRKRYDETGNTDIIDSVKAAKSNIMGLYLKLIDERGVDWLDKNDVVLFMVNNIKHNLRELNIKLKQLNKDKKYFNKLVDRITHKKTTPNLFNLVITQKTKEFNAEIEGLSLAIEIGDEGIKLLKEYKDTKIIVPDFRDDRSSPRSSLGGLFRNFTSTA